ncbi:MAG: phosphate--acyl-ACP acyltransferase, partial [Candidatus Zixiibacteriota bacterium]
FNHEAPRVGLLSIGEERSKGNELVFNAQKLLKETNINFVGNVEGRDILAGTVDVVVTDGFTGNILLKFGESIKPMLVNALQRQIQTNIFSRIAVMFMLPFMRRMRAVFDYEEAGGAPLLGVNGVVIICHGQSNEKAISNAVVAAAEMVRERITERIREEIIANHSMENNGQHNASENSRNGVLCTAPADDKR